MSSVVLSLWCFLLFLCNKRRKWWEKFRGGRRQTFFLLWSSGGMVLIPLKRLMGGLVYPGGMRSRQALLWSAENKREEGGLEEPGPTKSHPFISNLRTHTLTHCCTCAQARTHPPHPPQQSWYCGLCLSSVQLKTARMRASLHPPAPALPLCN